MPDTEGPGASGTGRWRGPPAALDALDPVMVLDRLGASGAAIEIGTVEEDGSRASAAFTATLDLGGVGEFDWAGALFLLEDGERGWRVDWSPGALHPALAPGGDAETEVAVAGESADPRSR